MQQAATALSPKAEALWRVAADQQLPGTAAELDGLTAALFARFLAHLQQQAHPATAPIQAAIDELHRTAHLLVGGRNACPTVGYTDPLYFSRRFHRAFGTSPTALCRWHQTRA